MVIKRADQLRSQFYAKMEGQIKLQFKKSKAKN